MQKVRDRDILYYGGSRDFRYTYFVRNRIRNELCLRAYNGDFDV